LYFDVLKFEINGQGLKLMVKVWN